MTDRRSGGCLVGIDFGGTKMALAVADLDGEMLERRVLPTLAEHGAEAALARALDCAEQMTADAGPVLAAGVATPGAVVEDRIELAPNVPGWDALRLGAALAERLGVEHVGVVNDLNAAALAELRRGQLRGVDPGMVVGLGTGVALAVTVGGGVVSGAHGAAGEIGYAPVGLGALTGADPILEHLFSGIALDRLAGERELNGAAELTAASDAGHRAAFEDRLGTIGRQLVTACLVLDPQRVVLVGGMTAGIAVVDGIREHLQRHVPMPPEIVVSDFPDDAALYGAVEVARDQLTVRAATSEPAGLARE